VRKAVINGRWTLGDHREDDINRKGTKQEDPREEVPDKTNSEIKRPREGKGLCSNAKQGKS